MRKPAPRVRTNPSPLDLASLCSLLALPLALQLAGGCTVGSTEVPVTTTDGSGHTAVQYPIVLIPGLYGFDRIVAGVRYWPGIPEALAEDGARVFRVESALMTSSEERGELLIPQIEEILAITGAAKVNLFGHSQGSMDARYIAAVRPDLVASVTGIAGPHKGSPIANVGEIRYLEGIAEGALGLLADLLILVGGPDAPNDPDVALHALTVEGTNEFTSRYPAGIPADCGDGDHVVNGIRYYSWSGTGILTNPVDILDPVWALTALAFSGEENDGLVGRCSSHLGEVIRDDYNQNHLDESNMMFALVSPLETSPETIFRAHANRLRNIGL